jgi:hypothetical protein
MRAAGGPVVAFGILLVAACKGAPAELPPSDAAYVRHDSGASADEPAPVPTVSGPLNSKLAQSLGMQAVQERWGYHPTEATAWRMPNGNWRVTVILHERNVTANVYFDNGGNLLDGGVFGAGVIDAGATDGADH